MTLVVEGVPTEISRDRICELISGLGLDPVLVQSLRMEPKTVAVVVCSLDEQGHRYLRADGALATYTLALKIT